MSQRHTTGSRVLAARQSKGLSLRRAARRLGVSPRALRGWEGGRDNIPYAVRLAMVTLYGIPRHELAPDRPAAAVQDAATGTITIGSVTFAAQGADDAALLADVLGGTPEDIVRNLRRLLGLSEKEAVELGRWMFRRTAVAGALAVGLLAGVVGTGTLSANPTPAGAGEISTAEHASIDPNWAVIGEAAVLERGDAAPHVPGTHN